MAKHYVGVIHKCFWEGESFGFYFPYTKTVLLTLQEIVSEQGVYSVDIKTYDALVQKDARDTNSYMDAVSLLRNPNCWDQVKNIELCYERTLADTLFYKGGLFTTLQKPRRILDCKK